MARARNIKPSIMDNEDLAALPPLTRLLFVYLWMLADREGRLEDRPGRIAHQALGYDRDADADAMLNELQQGGFIARYTANGIACIQILQFAKHQTPHIREAASELPAYAPAKVGAEHDLGECEPSPRSPDSTFPLPDSGFPLPDSSPNGEVSGPAPRAAPQPPPDFNGKNSAALNGKAIVQIAGDWELPEEWGIDAEALGWKPSQVLYQAEKFRQYWASGKGQGKRRSVKGWRQSWSNWLEKAAKDQR